MPKEYNDDDRVPRHPKTTDDYIKVQKWEEEFMDFLLSKGAARTARCGEAPRLGQGLLWISNQNYLELNLDTYLDSKPN